VACTQERRLFLELNQETEGAAGVQERPIHFVNIREAAGWSAEGAAGHAQDRRADGSGPVARAGPGAHRGLPQPRALPGHRRADAAERAALLLGDKLDVSLLLAGPARWHRPTRWPCTAAA
jgi:hypothetical protein